jgi:hypothetical protein
MTNEEETKTKRTIEEPKEMKPDPELRRMLCASKPLQIKAKDD